MQHYSTSQLAIITAVPTVTVILLWTLAIFHKNRKYWQPYDITIVAILIQSVLRNLTILAYTVLAILQTHVYTVEYCRAAIWFFNSLHTFQASTLSTLSVVGFYVINLHRKRREIKQYLTTAHIVYHLFCLTTLCACVGVAAILARHDWPESNSANFEFNYGKNLTNLQYFGLETCQFMPYNLDIKYNVFILTLHALLACVSAICFISIVFKYYKHKTDGFTYLKKSTSDLSDLSLGAAASTVSQKEEISKIYYDTYQKQPEFPNRGENVGFNAQKEQWNSDTSNISTSVSSTNSRRPCLKQSKEENGAGLETILPVLIVCYLFNHLPVIILCLFPWLVHPFSPPGAALWLALIQDTLLPSSLALVDSRFSQWVSKVYRCSRGGRKKQAEKLPHGLDGKFRPFTTTPQIESVAPIVQARSRPLTQQQDHKFPITNGSLYTSIDGHLPIIHNYRRHKGLRSPVHSVSMGLHSTYIKRQESILNQQVSPTKPTEQCDESFISLPADYTSLGSNINEPEIIKPQPTLRHFSVSQNSLADISVVENELKKMRQLSKSQENLSTSPVNVIQRDIQNFRKNPEVYQRSIKKTEVEKDPESSDEEYCNQSLSFQDDFKSYDTISSHSCCSITTEANCDFEFFGKNSSDSNEIANSYKFTNVNDDNYIMCLTPNNSGRHANVPVMRSFKPFAVDNTKNVIRKNSRSPRNNRVMSDKDFSRNFKITRSNSKRSLDKLDSYIRNSKRLERNSSILSRRSLNRFDSFNEKKIERSNSNRSYDLLKGHGDTYIIRGNSNRNEILNSFPDITDRRPMVNYLNLKNLNSSCIHFGDLKNSDYDENALDKQKKTVPVLSVESLCSILNHKGISYLDNGDVCNHNYGGSVPDFKKIFVSDYI